MNLRIYVFHVFWRNNITAFPAETTVYFAAGSLEGFDKEKMWCNIPGVGVSGQEDGAQCKMQSVKFKIEEDALSAWQGGQVL
ncbi:MAG TPA: hypothetical protein VN048_13425 [Verrucomicrobiae bacterium]|jgi:hypothetical protein|nr:hypothetical protein [Verrucomicrobiae bacterium]